MKLMKIFVLNFVINFKLYIKRKSLRFRKMGWVFINLMTSILLLLSAKANGKLKLRGCPPTQYVEYNESGTLHCNFPEDYLAVYWHDVIDNTEVGPIVTQDGNGKQGKGLETGEFDIFPNGSLIITNVSLAHEKTFTVLCLLPNDRFVHYYIEVVVTVTPEGNFPQISKCDDTGELCLHKCETDCYITCSVNGARPASEVLWGLVVGGRKIPLNTSVTIATNTNGVSDSSTVLDVASVSNSQLTHLICMSLFQQEAVWNSRHVIVDVIKKDVFLTSDLTFVPIYVERGTVAELSCAFKDNEGMYVWKKIDTNQTISYGVKKQDGTIFLGKTPARYELKPDGTLYIEETAIEDEGHFICLSSDGTRDNALGTKLVVLVPPSPPYIVIEECIERECIITFSETSSLSCSVRGIRPSVYLQWEVKGESNVQIKEQNRSTVLTDGLYRVASTIYLESTSMGTCSDTVIVTCTANGVPSYLFQSSRVVILKVNCTTEDNGHTTESVGNHSKGTFTILPILICVTVVIAIITFVIGIYFVCKKCRDEPSLKGDHVHQVGVAV